MMTPDVRRDDVREKMMCVRMRSQSVAVPPSPAEGASKPELTMPATSQVVHVQKIAVHVGISWESLQDWEAFRASVTTELTNRVIDVENSELRAGDGTTGHLTGLLGTSGILTHDGSVTLGGLTAIDHIEESIAELRGSAAAWPRPTWPSSIRRRGARFGERRTTRRGIWSRRTRVLVR